MVDLTNEQNDELIYIKSQFEDLYNSVKDENLLKQFDFFKKLFNAYALKGKFFYIRAKRPSEGEKLYTLKSQSILIGVPTDYFISSLHKDFDHSSKHPGYINEIGLGISSNKYYSNIIFGQIENEQIKKHFENFAKENNYEFSGNYRAIKHFDSFEDFEDFEKIIDSFLRSNNLFEPITFDEFIRLCKNRIKSISNYLHNLNTSKFNHEKTDGKIFIDNIFELKKQIILFGPPGTGKTFMTKNKAVEVINND